ncbi:hypothetical protein QWY86_01080 [Pedobacter aquatilis]|uniref:hypothetical protein n=1 Tax=Pedobacter aquatilis TaxID=351343 RepID=UPI0025B3A9C5|nr:hypothetical protein [Pedobacter aquatilis]MDN3585242.1 hypothetical protein [Pedobacter aquatilis]
MENHQTKSAMQNSEADKTEKLERKHIYKFILAPFSFESSHHFNKIHKRKFNSFGCIHELSKLPGAMF